MPLIRSFILPYTDYRDEEVNCGVRVYEDTDHHKPLVVVLTELPGGDGSLTNTMYKVCRRVWLLLDKPARGVIWIEHLPKELFDRDSFTEVRFDLPEFASYEVTDEEYDTSEHDPLDFEEVEWEFVENCIGAKHL